MEGAELEFCIALKKAREQIGLSQQSFADQLGVSFSTVNRWEQGRHVPNKITIKAIEALCKEHNIQFSYSEEDKYAEDCKPVFYSTPSSFTVVIKNVNYNMNGTTIHAADHDTVHVVSDREASIIEFCSVARTREEIQAFIGITNRGYFRSSILKPLLDAGKLKMTIPDKPKSTNQKYIKV